MSQTPVRVFIYCRLSRKGGRSIERQEAEGRRIAAERGWEIAAVFKETMSASRYARGERKEWKALLQAVEHKECDAIIVWMEDRSSRDLVDAGEFVKLCEEVGLRRVILPSYDYDLTDPEDQLKFYGEVLNAQREVVKMSRRVRSAKRQEAEDGWPAAGGNRAFGDPGGRRVRDPEKPEDDPDKWLRDPETGCWRRVGTIPAEQVERERELIREAVARIRAGDSLRGILADWRERGVRAAGGEPFTTRSLRKVLLQPRLAGLREYNGTLYSSREMEPIVSRAEWEEVREILTDPARREPSTQPGVTGPGGVARHLLSGMAFCGICGARMRARRSGGKRTLRQASPPNVYTCPGPSDGGGWHTVRNARALEELIEGALYAAVESPEWDELAGEQRTAGEDEPTRELTERLARDQGRLDRLDDDVLLAELDDDRRRAASIRRVRADVEARMERTRAMLKRRLGTRVITEVPPNLREVWPGLSLDRKRAILAAVLKLPPEGKAIQVFPQGKGQHKLDPETIVPDWRA